MTSGSRSRTSAGMGRAGVVRCGKPHRAVRRLRVQVGEHGEHAPVVLGGARKAKLLEDARHVLLDRPLGNDQALRDPLVRSPSAMSSSTSRSRGVSSAIGSSPWDRWNSGFLDRSRSPTESRSGWADPGSGRCSPALLLLRANEDVSRDWLIDELWEERPPRSGATALHNHVARIRRVLGPDRVVTRPDGYTLRVEPGELDLHGFEALVADTATLPLAARARADPRGAGPVAWGAARGECDRGLRRRRGGSARGVAVEDLIDAELELGRHAELVSELMALVAAHRSASGSAGS